MMLQLGRRQSGDVVIVDCTGKIIFDEEAEFLRTYVKDLLNQHHRIVLNMAAVSHIDSNGIGTLVELWAAARRGGGDLKPAALKTHVHDVLTFSNLTFLFDTFETAEQAARRAECSA